MILDPNAGFPDLMKLAAGFRPAKILMVATELGVFDHLETPQSPEEVAAKIKAAPRATGILLNALAALGLVHKEGERFHNSEAASLFLVPGKDDYRGAILRHLDHTWGGWSDLQETVVKGSPPEREPEKWLDRHEETEAEWMRQFIWGMHALARDLAPQVAARLNLSGVRHLLDLGGGPGTYAITFCQAHPELKATVFYLPGPVQIAQENIARHGLSHRLGTLEGNFLKDGIGSGYDFIWISHILHSHDEEQCHLIIDKALLALNPGCTLAIQDFFLNDDGVSPVGAAMFSVHMLAVTPRGRSLRHSEVADWLLAAGLADIQHIETTPDASVVLARKG